MFLTIESHVEFLEKRVDHCWHMRGCGMYDAFRLHLHEFIKTGESTYAEELGKWRFHEIIPNWNWASIREYILKHPSVKKRIYRKIDLEFDSLERGIHIA